MGSTIVVPFEGADVGESELTWGQRHIWDWIRSSGAPLSMSAVRVLDEGAKVDETVDLLRYFMNRFQAMRTRLRVDADGRTRQVVTRAGEVTLEIVDTDDAAGSGTASTTNGGTGGGSGTDPAAVADRIVARHQATHFNYFHEWPVRMTLVRHEGALTHLVTTLCHLFFDAAAAMVMFRDLQANATGPVTGATPLELAAWQGSPAGQRQSAAALRYWEKELRAVPAADPTGAAAGAGDGCWQLEYDSPAAALAAVDVAARLGVDTAAVLLTAYAVALARVTGRTAGPLELIVSNRFRPGCADSVSPVNQTGLLVPHLDGLTFADAVEQVRRRTFTAYKHAYFDPERQQDLIARISADRGVDLGLGYVVNDRRTQPPVTRDAAEPRMSRLDTVNKRLIAYFSDVPTIMLQTDGRYVPRESLEPLAREIESVLRAA